MGKYDHLFVRTPRPAHLTHYKLPQDIRRSIAWMDSSVAEGACSFECIWYYKPMEGPPAHVHEDSCEILGYFGDDDHRAPLEADNPVMRDRDIADLLYPVNV